MWSLTFHFEIRLHFFTLQNFISDHTPTLYRIVSVRITGGNSLLESAKADHANKQKFCSFEKNMNHTMKWSSYKTLGQISQLRSFRLAISLKNHRARISFCLSFFCLPETTASHAAVLNAFEWLVILETLLAIYMFV